MASLAYSYQEQQLDFLHLCSLGDENRVRNALLSGRVDKNYRHSSNGWLVTELSNFLRMPAFHCFPSVSNNP